MATFLAQMEQQLQSDFAAIIQQRLAGMMPPSQPVTVPPATAAPVNPTIYQNPTTPTMAGS